MTDEGDGVVPLAEIRVTSPLPSEKKDNSEYFEDLLLQAKAT